MTKRKKRLLRLLIVLAVLLLLIAAELLYSNYHITVSRYSVSSDKLEGAFRLLFLSDLHGREFGTDNSRLLEKMKAEAPDLICFVGDIFNLDAEEAEIAAMCRLIRAAGDIAPVYFGMGNHEQSYVHAHGSALLDRITEAGAVLLDNGYLDLEINGNSIRLGGYMGYYRTPHMNTSDYSTQQRLSAFAQQFEETDRFKLLLNHIPTNWLDWEYRDRYPVDLVLSGHYHGGVIRIPLLEQGLYAPYVGKFPPYTKGLFAGEKATCILSTGLAGSFGFPRFFNPPELVLVELSPMR